MNASHPLLQWALSLLGLVGIGVLVYLVFDAYANLFDPQRGNGPFANQSLHRLGSTHQPRPTPSRHVR